MGFLRFSRAVEAAGGIHQGSIYKEDIAPRKGGMVESRAEIAINGGSTRHSDPIGSLNPNCHPKARLYVSRLAGMIDV